MKADPQLSDREHGRRTGASKNTVATVRDELAESGQVDHFPERIDPRTGKASQPVAHDLSMSKSDIEAEYADMGVVAPRADRPELVQRLRSKGLTQQQIAGTIGVSQQAVSLITKNGIEPAEPITNSRGQQRPATYERKAKPRKRPYEERARAQVEDTPRPPAHRGGTADRGPVCGATGRAGPQVFPAAPGRQC